MAKPLSVRAAAILRSDDAPTKDITAILPELAEAREQELARQRQAEADSVDIGLAETDRDEAAMNAARAGRLAQGYADATAGLEAKLKAREQSESRRRREAEQAAALAQRDEIAERFRAAVPGLVEQLTALFAEVVENEERMRASGIREASAEAVARGLPASFKCGDAELRRFTRMIVPAWDANSRAWPPHERATLPVDYETRLRETRRQVKAAAAERETETWGFYRLSHRLGKSVRFAARVVLSSGEFAEQTKERALWKGEWCGSLTHREAERLRDMGVKVETIDRASADAEGS